MKKNTKTNYKVNFNRIREDIISFSKKNEKKLLFIISLSLITLWSWVFDSSILVTAGILFFIDYLSYNIWENIGKNIIINNSVNFEVQEEKKSSS